MAAHPHHTGLTDLVQAEILGDDHWRTTVVPRLPAALASQTHLLGAVVRVRGIQTPTDLLRALLVVVLCGSSLRGLGAWATLIHLASLSAVAWGNRLEAASPWLHWLIGALLDAAVRHTRPADPHLRRILLIDTTCFRRVGGTGDDQRLHRAYDVLAGQMATMRITDRHTAERLDWLTLQGGDLVVGDCADGQRTSLAHLSAAQADGLLRVYLPHVPLTTPQTKPLGPLHIAVLEMAVQTRPLGSGKCRD